MATRRTVVGTIAGAIALSGFDLAAWAEGDGLPSATIVKGEPTVLDYGGGLKVPCSRDAFYTLWEGDTFWLTFGFGVCPSTDISKIRAEKQASGIMKFMLLTLAFAPNRLLKVDGSGWRKKDPKAHDFVIGDLPLPTQRNKSMSDAFLGAGNVQINPLWDRLAPEGGIGNGPLDNMQQTMRYAFSSSFVMKKDMTLDDVRKRAVMLQL